MMTKLIAFGLLVVSVSGCSTNRAAEPANNVKASNVNIDDANAGLTDYGEGFFPPEQNQKGSWRWMGPAGVVKLKNTHLPMMLKIRGRAPVEELPGPVSITFEFNGQQLDEVTASKDAIETEYRIAAAQQGSGDWSELRIGTTASYVPHDIDPKSADRRRLAFNLYDLTWQQE